MGEASPAVLHQVQDDPVQKFLHEGRADPQVLQGLRCDVGLFGLLLHTVVIQLVLVLFAGRTRKQVELEERRREEKTM